MLTITLSLQQQQQLRRDLEEKGFTFTQPDYTQFQAKGPSVTCTLYTSGKCVIQGKEAKAFIEFYLEPELVGITEKPSKDLTPHIGSDETGKGDFFGPLCVVALYADEATIHQLEQWGVKDSKTLSPAKIHTLATQIRALTPYHLVRLSPKTYNRLYAQCKNLNKLLAWCHATAIEAVVQQTNCHIGLIDQFSKAPLVQRILKEKGVSGTFHQRTRAEEDIVVAAASIVARDAFVEGIKILSKQIGTPLLLGASKEVLAQGIALYAEHGLSIFEEISKTHFKTLDAIRKAKVTHEP